MTSFNALSGAELQAFVAYQVEKAMRDSGEFTPNVSFPWFTFKFSLTIQALSGVPGDTRVAEGGSTKVGVEGGQGELPPASEGVAPLAEVEFTGAGEISVPDEARIEVGLPIMEQVMEHGINVDKPRLVAKKKTVSPAVAPWKEEEDAR